MATTRKIFGMQNTIGFELKALLSVVAIALLCLPATAQLASNSTTYTVTNLVSDIQDAATNQDTDLVNPWGLVAVPPVRGGYPTTAPDFLHSTTVPEPSRVWW